MLIRQLTSLAYFVLFPFEEPNRTESSPMARQKTEEFSKDAGKQSPFTFRRIQSRELYQPANDADGNTRVRFRVRVQILGRGAQQ